MPERSAAAPPGGLRLAYLVSQYPAVNHTFVLREIRTLRRLGVRVDVTSISRPDRGPHLMTTEEIEENDSTFHVKAAGATRILGDHIAAAFTRPVKYFSGLALAVGMGRFHPGKTLSALIYFGEAVVVGRWMQAKCLPHVHIHFSSTVGLILQRIFPITMSITVHGPAEFDDPDSFRLAEKIEKSEFVCAISNYGRSQMMKVSDPSQWDKIEVSPLGIDPGVFAPRPMRRTPETFEMITVGRLAPVKAQHIAVDAVRILREQGRSVRLRLVGDGPDRESLERYVSEHGLSGDVLFEGWRNQNEVLKLYEQADIFVLPSFAEGVPVVLMEAMAMEIPCVATRITGIPELIRDEVDGLLAAPSSSDELAAQITRLMDDDELRERLGTSARKRVLEKYDLEENTKRLKKIMKRRLAAAAVSPSAGGGS